MTLEGLPLKPHHKGRLEGSLGGGEEGGETGGGTKVKPSMVAFHGFIKAEP